MPITYICSDCKYVIAVLHKKLYSKQFIKYLHTQIDQCNKKYAPKVWNDEEIEKLFLRVDVNAKYEFWEEYKKII